MRYKSEPKINLDKKLKNNKFNKFVIKKSKNNELSARQKGKVIVLKLSRYFHQFLTLLIQYLILIYSNVVCSDDQKANTA